MITLSAILISDICHYFMRESAASERNENVSTPTAGEGETTVRERESGRKAMDKRNICVCGRGQERERERESWKESLKKNERET